MNRFCLSAVLCVALAACDRTVSLTGAGVEEPLPGAVDAGPGEMGSPCATEALCLNPPLAKCLDGQRLSYRAPTGRCAESQCVYEERVRTCTSACSEGHCVGEWRAMRSPTAKDLYAVWSSGSDDVWVGGDRVLAHYDGSSWRTDAFVPSGRVQSIRGFSSRDIFAAADTALLHFDGLRWSEVMPLGVGLQRNAPCVASLGNEEAAVLESRPRHPLTRVARAVDGGWTASELASSWNNAWREGGCTILPLTRSSGFVESGHIYRWESGELVEMPGTGSPLVMTEGGTLLAMRTYRLYEWNGLSWTQLPGREELTANGMAGRSAERLHVVGEAHGIGGGTARFYADGGFQPAPLPEGTPALTALWSDRSGRTFAVGLKGAILERD